MQTPAFFKSRFWNKKNITITGVSILGLLSLLVLINSQTHFISFGADTLASLEAEGGTIAGAIAKKSDSLASGGEYIEFGSNPVTPTPTPGAFNPDFQPGSPYYATFFYPWYENPNTDGRWSQWTDNAHTPPQNWFSHFLPDPDPSRFDPATELYSAKNDAILYWQLSKLAEARQEVAIASWWGQTHKTNSAFSKIIKDVMNRPDNPYPYLRWAVYYEKEGFGNPTVSEIVNDLNYIKNNYANQRGYFKIQGKPVVFVYNASHTGFDPLEDLARWKEARNQTGFYVVMKSDPLTRGANASDMDSWHQYAPAVRRDTTSPYWFMVSPGFWLEGQSERLVRDAGSFETEVRNMVSANVTWKLTETWNEWGEGSGVEPAQQVNQTTSGAATLKSDGYPFGNLYVDILKRNLPNLEQGTGAGIAQASPTPQSSAPPSTGDAVIVAAGDISCDPAASGAACKQRETSDLINTIAPNAVLALGDIQYEAGQYANFVNYYHPTWGRFKSITYPAVGNHEYGTAGAAGYFDYFNGAGNNTGRAGDRDKGYYAFNVGSWRIYSLNSNCSKAGGCRSGDPQVVWLRNDLQANAGTRCVMAYFHHPRFSSGHDGNNTTLINTLNDIWRTLYDANADVVLAGHSHHYERFAPMTIDANGNPVLDPARGIKEFVVGTGGRNFTGFWGTAPNSEVRQNNAFGVLKMTLHDASYDWEFVPIAGSTYTDRGSANCH